MTDSSESALKRRDFMQGTVAGAALGALGCGRSGRHA
jgi:hypothetical protein